MNRKKNKIIILPILALVLGCNATLTTTNTSNKNTAKTTATVSSVNTTNTNTTDILPDSSDNGSLQDKYNLNTYIQTNKILESIPYSLVDTYKVNFTSDGGPIFAIKDTKASNDVLWKKTTKKLLFDTFQLLNVDQSSLSDVKYYSRYSQLIESNINVTLPDGQVFDNTANLVQTVGLSMKKITNGYQISGLTPVTVRQVEKNNLKYQIDKVSLDYGSSNLIINADKTLIPWPGISLNGVKKGSLKVFISSKDTTNNPLEVLISIGKEQFQLTKNSDMSFSGDFQFPELQDSKTSLVIELIDQNSLTKNAIYQGYTWIIPFVS